MTAQSTPIGMDLSEAAQKRHNMVMQCYERLQYFAFQAQFVNNLRNDKAVLVCIKVDTEWRSLVDVLMPDVNWQQFRDIGQEPVAIGTVQFFVCEVIAKKMPSIKDALIEKPSEGFYKCIALDEGGGTVYEIEPKEKL